MKQVGKIKDLTGKKFGRLTVIGFEERKSKKTYWVCQCDCGNMYVARGDALVGGNTKSCGCLKKESDRRNLTANHSHKMSGTRIYDIWMGMKMRCENPNNARYHNYGGRGIKVCDEWDESFTNFYKWASEHGYADTLTLDRIDNDKGYCPENCRWANNKEQSNNRTTNIKITIGNATKTLTEWCEIFELDYKTVNARYHRQEDITIDRLFRPC